MTDMTDNTEPNVEIIGQETPPRLSEDGIAYQKGLLADEQWCEEFPAQAAALRASLDIALAATGQNLEPPPDQRSAAQRLHDQRLGVMPRTADQYGDWLARADRDTIDVDRDGRCTAGVLHRRIPAQHLFDRIRPQGGVVA